jgi:hypothetical protein
MGRRNPHSPEAESPPGHRYSPLRLIARGGVCPGDGAAVSTGAPMPAVPVEDEQGRIVGEHGPGHGKDIVCQPPGGLSWVQAPGLADLTDQVQRRGTTLEHAVGDHHQTVTRLEDQLGGAESGVGEHPERELRRELDRRDGTSPCEVRRNVPGVDQRQSSRSQVEPSDQSGDEALNGALLGVLENGVIRGAGLLEQGAALSAVFRRLPTHRVAVRALLTPCPMASVKDRCSTSRPRL